MHSARNELRREKFFSYELPPDRIAQHSHGFLGRRTDAKLLHAFIAHDGLRIEDSVVRDLPALLRPGDVLVLNNSKVVPCRFHFEYAGGRCEIFLLEREKPTERVWLALARPMRRLKPGANLNLSEHLSGTVLGRDESGERIRIELLAEHPEHSIEELISREGSMPIPGYIRAGVAEERDEEFYQTVFAKHAGSVAAPTAGLHFTEALLDQLRERGVEIRELTLHVGPASFQPVRDPAEHEMPTEWYSISAEVLAALDRAKAEGRRIVAVGTTSARSLESAARVRPKAGEFVPTQLFITPGFEFNYVDVLMTNFHQPETTHLLLVAAFIGERETEKIYTHALESEYRFLSYGDAMLLERGAQK